MRRRIPPLLITTTLLLALSSQASAEPRRYRIDPDHTSIGFLVMHAGYEQVLGRFRTVTGGFTYNADQRELTGGTVEIAADSVFTDHEERDAHLRGGDFLAAETHPTVRFEAQDLELDEAGKGALRGQLTLLGETRPVSLDVTLNKAADYPFGHGQYTLGISARGAIERSRFGMDYGVANELVGDQVELLIELEAIRQPKD